MVWLDSFFFCCLFKDYSFYIVMIISLKNQEIFGWIGNIIFILGLTIQFFHVYKVKDASDVSYGLCILWVIGNMMYTTFGYLDNSDSLFIGSSISLFISSSQLIQKIYYQRYYNRTQYETV